MGNHRQPPTPPPPPPPPPPPICHDDVLFPLQVCERMSSMWKPSPPQQTHDGVHSTYTIHARSLSSTDPLFGHLLRRTSVDNSRYLYSMRPPSLHIFIQQLLQFPYLDPSEPKRRHSHPLSRQPLNADTASSSETIFPQRPPRIHRLSRCGPPLRPEQRCGFPSGACVVNQPTFFTLNFSISHHFYVTVTYQRPTTTEDPFGSSDCGEPFPPFRQRHRRFFPLETTGFRPYEIYN